MEQTNPGLLPPDSFLSNIGLMLTYRCTIACPHCIVNAGPNRTEEITVHQAGDWIHQIAGYRDGRIKGLALTGGEPFCNPESLSTISSLAESLGLTVSAVTNAFWASSKQQALETLERLPAVKLLSFSTDIYHQRSIPLERIGNAVWAAERLDRIFNLAVCTENEDDAAFIQLLNTLQSMIDPDKIRVSITFPAGRAVRRNVEMQHHLSDKPVVSACTMAGSPVIFPNGRVIGCIGPLITLKSSHPMALGDLNQQDLGSILDRAEMNPILHSMRIWGPHLLVSLLESSGYAHLLPKKYISNCICDACFKMLSNPAVVEILQDLLRDDQNRKVIAYGRLHYLQEIHMYDHLGLDGSEDFDPSRGILASMQ